MTDPIITSLIGLCGIVIGALLAGWLQRTNTRSLIQSEFRKIRAQISGESKARFHGKKQDWLLEAVPELIAIVDPEVHAEFDHERVVALIHRIQVVLDLRNETEMELNQASTNLGLTIQAVSSGQAERGSLFSAQSDVIEAARKFFQQAF